MKKDKGITLIALVITIIILIILAGVSINLIFGQEGIINKTKQGSETYKEEQAKERLELELANLTMEKVDNKDYNENEFLTERLTQKGFIVNENIVTVDGWKFEVDRSVPKVVANLGKGEENKEIQISTIVTNNSDNSKATIKIEITYTKSITKILINNNIITLPEKIDGKYVLEAIVEQNGQYIIKVEDELGKYRTSKVSVTGIIGHIEINSKEQLKLLAENVNNGETYQGKTIILKQNINLNEGKYTVNQDGTMTFNSDAEQWIPIGTTNNPFKGTFDGKGYTISNMYINGTNVSEQGLFGKNQGIIKNVKIENASISTLSQNVGILVGYNDNTGIVTNVKTTGNITSTKGRIGGIVGDNYGRVELSTNKASVEGNQYVGGIVGYNTGGTITKCGNLSEKIISENFAGGITGVNGESATIEESYNLADVESTGYMVGGICGVNQNESSILDCYNKGAIKGEGKRDGSNNTYVGGITGCQRNTGTVKNCYNIGAIYGKYRVVGGIVGNNADSSTETGNPIQTVCNVFNTGNISSSLGTASKEIGSEAPFVAFLIGNIAGHSMTGVYGNTSQTEMSSWTNEQITTNLSDKFINDILNDDGTWEYNNGYPILKWQMEK